MKRPYSGILMLLQLFAVLHTRAQVCPAPGTYAIGPTGYYNSLTAAINNLSTCTLTGAYVLEFQPAYHASVETFPITVPLFNGSSSVHTVTIRPQTGATNIFLSSSNTTGTILFSGAAHVVFDGRPGGTGSPYQLTIENTHVGAAYAAGFVNDAVLNTLQYCNLRSANNSSSSGTIVFGTAGTGQGNDDNSISHCNIYDAATGTPANAIYQFGSASPNDNSNNVITGNNIYNFYSAANDMNGILLANNASGWTISGNSFYQTATRNLVGVGNIFSAVKAAATSVSGIAVYDNYIGGTAAAAAGTALTLTGSGGIIGISLAVSTASTTEVHGNLVRNIAFTSSSAVRNALIKVNAGKCSIGTIATPNHLGSQLATGSITVSLSNTGAFPSNPFFEGIAAGGGVCDTVKICGNTIGGIAVSGTSTTAFITGISFTGSSGVFNVEQNTVGSTTVSNSLSSALNSYLLGIWGWASVPSTVQRIEQNTVSNCTSSSTASTNLYLCGILTQGSSVYHTSGNQVFKLTTASTSTQNSLIGIYNHASTGTGQQITNNTIYQLSNAAASSASGLVGIYYTGPATGDNIVSGNFVHSLSVSTTNLSGYIHGIYSIGGATIFKNNMVRLGIRADGTSLNRGCFIFGMAEKAGATVSNQYYHNSVYIGGTSPATTSKTYAFYSTVTGNTRRYYNNIFYNARSSSSSAGSGRHYAIQIQDLAGCLSDYNDLIATGTDRMLGFYGTNITTLSGWRTATGFDANSISAYPGFALPAGTAATVDLHINSAAYTLVEGGGTPLAAVTDDFDAEVRAANTPADLGADAINNAAAVKIDVGVTALARPATGACYSNAEVVKARIKNYGLSAIDFSITPVTVSVAVTGTATQNMTGILNAGTLAAGDSTEVLMSTTLNMTTAGTYTFNAGINAVSGTGADADITNDTLLPAATRISSGTGVTWTGVNNNWNDPVNWCGGIPGTHTDITIPNLGMGANYPVIQAGDSGTVRNIIIEANASVTIADGGVIGISGAITNNGAIANFGEVLLNGSISTSFPGTGALTAMNHLTIEKTAGTVTLNKAMQISGILKPVSGSIMVNNRVTLRSTADSTASVGTCTASITYGDSGEFEVQRFIPAKRAWRLLTAPVTATASVYENWQNDGVYTAGKGMHITGPGANPGVNGLDLSTQNNFSLKCWDITAQGMYGIGNTLATMLSHNSNPVQAENTGYFVFIRGDRNPANTTQPNVNATTLCATGRLQTGTQVVEAAASSGDPAIQRLTLVGNPYASPIDFGQLVKTNLLDKFYVWDPVPSDFGRYVTITRSGGTYIATPDRGPDGPNRYIQSGQAFFVETGVNTMVTPTLTIEETHKVNEVMQTIFRPALNRQAGMKINLYRRNTATGETMLADGVQALYGEAYSKKISTSDALKLPNLSESFSLLKNTSKLAVYTAPLLTLKDTLFLHMEGLGYQAYRLTFSPEKLDTAQVAAFVEDKYSGKVTPLYMDKVTHLDFVVSADEGAAAADRFMLVYRPSVEFNSITARVEKGDVVLQWQLASEQWMSRYVIQRSADGVNYIDVAEKAAVHNDGKPAGYTFTDAVLQPGTYYYRIKSINTTDIIAYSKAVKLVVQYGLPAVQVLPNPVKGNTINIRLAEVAPGSYTLVLMNNLGQPVLQSKLQHTGGNALHKISLASDLQPGTYQLEISGAGVPTTVMRVMVL
ncbi:MAG TPA: T9SS type A sorting domain-containing protein [Ferruginibacter sp.]|nr:T9SS type A sorting domain-containing protein [Ferruginibacter sp.]